MFGLFKKKEKPAPQAESTQELGGELSHTVNEKYGPFTGEVVELSAVTGPNAFFVPAEDLQADPNGPWAALLGLTAWYEDDEPTVKGQACLVAAADERLLSHLRRMAPRDSMIQVKARKSEKENIYLMTALPTPIMDPELKAILLEQVKPVTLALEGLGEFTLSRANGLFQGELPWLDEPVSFTFAQCEGEELEQVRATALALAGRAQEWTGKAVSAAAELTGEEDLAVMAIDLSSDGTFAFWLGNENDPEAACLQGSLEGGFVPAEV